MNQAAIDFAVADTNTKILEYDSFIHNKPSSVLELCDFLEIPFADDYINELQKPTGPVSATNNLSQTEYESILSYNDLYNDMCERAGVTIGKGVTEIHAQYDGKSSKEDFNPDHQGSTTNRLRNVIRAQNNQIQHLKAKRGIPE